MRLLTVDEVAAALRVSRGTVNRWARTGRIRAFRVGARWKIDGDALEAKLAAGSV